MDQLAYLFRPTTHFNANVELIGSGGRAGGGMVGVKVPKSFYDEPRGKAMVVAKIPVILLLPLMD